MCGITAVINVPKAAELAVVGAHELQHRARTYAGAVSSDGTNFYRDAGKGLARQIFSEKRLNRLHGRDAIVHLRYPTGDDEEDRDNTQPLHGIYRGQPIAVAHNGNLVNVEELTTLLPPSTKMCTSIDTEYIVRLLEIHQKGGIVADLTKVLSLLKGSFALCILLPDCMVVAMDPTNNRPLSIAKLEGGYCVASETCAFPVMGATYLQDVAPGTMVVISDGGLETIRFAEPRPKRCVFELLYNSHPASRVFNISIARFRKKLGQRLAELFPVENGVDLIVTPVPDSGIPYARGFASNGLSGEDFQVVWRNHYVGRTFNAATQALRDEEIARKFIFDSEEIRGKRVIVVDDSIVRGSTLPKIAAILWQLRAKEVHVRIASPPITYLCKYGIYMDEDQTDLIAGKMSSAEMAKHFGVTTLEFLPHEELKGLLQDPENYCFACQTGEYWH